MQQDDNINRTIPELSEADHYEMNGEPSGSVRPGRRKSRRIPVLRLLIPFLLGVICSAAAFYAVTDLLDLGRFITQDKYDYYKSMDDEYGKYAEIMRMISEDPLAEDGTGEIDDDKLKELVAGIGDPYAQYYTPEEYKEFRRKYSGDYVGIGVVVTEEDGKIVIKSVLEGSPAEESGLLVEDIITAVDGKKPADIDEAIDLISGEAGSAVSVTIDRGGEESDFSITRARIEQESVAYEEYDGDSDIGYIRIALFREDTDLDFKRAVKALKKQGCDSFIIDLRENGGGIIDSSIAIADYLLPACRIMSEKKKDGSETVHNSKAGSADIKYVVLVNENTASASEILTAAIQDNNGGAVIGEKTYGKGVTQMTHMFDDGSAIKITVTEYFRPDGGTVNGVGITPDIEAEDDEAMERALEELGR